MCNNDPHNFVLPPKYRRAKKESFSFQPYFLWGEAFGEKSIFFGSDSFYAEIKLSLLKALHE